MRGFSRRTGLVLILLLLAALVIYRSRPAFSPPVPPAGPSAEAVWPSATSRTTISPSPHSGAQIPATRQPPATASGNLGEDAVTPTTIAASVRSELPQSLLDEWSQDAANPMRTGYIAEDPGDSWELLWTWNGPDQDGKPGEHFYDAPQDARTIAGGGYIFVPAGEQGLFALLKENGEPAWHLESTSFNASPAYDGTLGMLFAGGQDGLLYQILAKTGEVVRTYRAGSPINKAVLLAPPFVYVVSEMGSLHKVSSQDLEPEWVYQGGLPASTSPAFSPASGVIVFADTGLFVHAVNDSDGTPRWRVKPTSHPAEEPYTFDGYWPVIAEQAGVVFVRLNLGMGGLWTGPGEGQKYPSTSKETRTYLEANPHLKNLFALDLQDGSEKFIPAVGYGGIETLDRNGKAELITGPVPVVRPLEDGREAVYMHFRSGDTPHMDGRWDSHLGEMVLDDASIPGLEAGDLRFIRWRNSYVHITDEQSPLTMAGEVIFHAHWGASEAARLKDRSPGLGLTYENGMPASSLPVVIRRQQACSDFDPGTHYTRCDLTLYEDGRFWNGPGFWTYWDSLDPPTPSRRAYSEGLKPRYTYVSGGLVIVQGNGGELMVFQGGQR